MFDFVKKLESDKEDYVELVEQILKIRHLLNFDRKQQIDIELSSFKWNSQSYRSNDDDYPYEPKMFTMSAEYDPYTKEVKQSKTETSQAKPTQDNGEPSMRSNVVIQTRDHLLCDFDIFKDDKITVTSTEHGINIKIQYATPYVNAGKRSKEKFNSLIVEDDSNAPYNHSIVVDGSGFNEIYSNALEKIFSKKIFIMSAK